MHRTVALILVALIVPLHLTTDRTPRDALATAYPVTTGPAGDLLVGTSDEALSHDLALVAEARGWKPAEAAAYQRAEQAIGHVAEQVAAKRPDAFVGSALSPQPGGAPTLYIKGPADRTVRDLVAAADVAIEIADNQPFSFDELEARKIRVHRALQAAGFREVVTRIDITGAGAIRSTIREAPGQPAIVEDILALIPADVRSSVELTIRDVPVVVPAGAFGGMKVQDDGAFKCTSGWTVVNLTTFVRGVTGAGHCTGVNQINHPGHGVHGATWKAAHEGQWGDVEWYTTAEYEADDFYADAATVRDVDSVETRASISVGELVCIYGRASNSRNCSMQVRDVSLACGNLDRLVQMDDGFNIGGDSGGGWSFNFTAYGATYGSCDALDSWSVADLFDEALGVIVTSGG